MLSQLLLARVLLPLGFGDQDESKRVAWATDMGLYSLSKSNRSYAQVSHPSCRGETLSYSPLLGGRTQSWPL